MDLEDGEAVLRCLDHGCHARRQVGAVGAGSLLGAEQGAQGGDVEAFAGPVHDGVEHRLHLCARAEQQVPAVLDLVDAVAVAEQGAFLVGEIEPEAQARRVDPPVADLAQTPCSRGMRQGVCDLGQALGVSDGGGAIAFLDEGYARRPGSTGDVLVAVQDDLRAEGRVARHLDRHMSPVGVEDVERVVVDEHLLLGQVAEHATLALGTLHVPGGGRGTGDQDQEHADAEVGMGGEVLLGDEVLALAALAVDDRHAVGRAPRPDATTEPARHPHQMGIVQVVVVVAVPAPPPHSEPARAVAQREVGVQHDAIHAVVRTGQQVAVAGGQVVEHIATVRRESRITLPELPRRGPRSRASEASLGIGVDDLGAGT